MTAGQKDEYVKDQRPLRDGPTLEAYGLYYNAVCGHEGELNRRVCGTFFENASEIMENAIPPCVILNDGGHLWYPRTYALVGSTLIKAWQEIPSELVDDLSEQELSFLVINTVPLCWHLALVESHDYSYGSNRGDKEKFLTGMSRIFGFEPVDQAYSSVMRFAIDYICCARDSRVELNFESMRGYVCDELCKQD